MDDARRVAAQLEIPYYVMNFKEEFKHHVIDYFVEEYRQGRTPNPCIACNRYVKWESSEPEPGDWSGLYRDRTLCKDRLSGKWALYIAALCKS